MRIKILNFLTSAHTLQTMKLIAKNMSSFVNYQNPVFIRTKLVTESLTVFRAKMRTGNRARLNSNLMKLLPLNVIKPNVVVTIFSSKPLLVVESVKMKIVIKIGRF